MNQFFIALVLGLSYFHGVWSVKFHLSQPLEMRLKKDHIAHPKIERHLAELAHKLNVRLEKMSGAIDIFSQNTANTRSDAYTSLENSLGKYFKFPQNQQVVFPALKNNFADMRVATVIIDDIVKPDSLPPEHQEPVQARENGKIIMTFDFFLHQGVKEERKLGMLLREIFITLFRKHASLFTITTTGKANWSDVTPVFNPKDLRRRPGQEEVNGDWLVGYSRLLQEPNGPKALVYNPDLYYVLGFCVDHNGRTPPTQYVVPHSP
ncbi:hypothetical protein BJ165DRAFT_1616015 [Panaeolus papilionaceus]|nr:hypothetical protein BJ165DRAFT_1616015 [Panaeolus papilionaceus]